MISRRVHSIDPRNCAACAAHIAEAAAEAELAARIDADNARIRTELHHRLNQLDDTQLDNLAHELADQAPDAVNDALNEIGAP